ncbi:hypothetical protein [Rothia uropygialis]|uniref:hypothetical protein n=1 Tax=Kocuria sp. 36 TaxID=1415402 RepID=UPI0013EB4ED0|nr:hypothetical protein [Kocuria sp. 36]
MAQKYITVRIDDGRKPVVHGVERCDSSTNRSRGLIVGKIDGGQKLFESPNKVIK